MFTEEKQLNNNLLGSSKSPINDAVNNAQPSSSDPLNASDASKSAATDATENSSTTTTSDSTNTTTQANATAGAADSSNNKEVKGKVHTFYQVLIDSRDCPYIVSFSSANNKEILKN